MIVYGKEGQEQLYSAISKLVSDENFRTVLKWFMDSLQEKRARNDTLRDEEGRPLLTWNQGACQNLLEILNEAATARATLEKLKKAHG